MKPKARIEGYYRQNGGWLSLTPRQRRRVEHKSGRDAAQFARQLALSDELIATLLAMGDGTKTMVNVCQRCGAFADNPCITVSGTPARKPHAGRGT